jgi:carboxypeptidase C (cathepsin A)
VISYPRKGTTEEAAKDIAAFLAIFFESMDGLKGRALHIAGESYGVIEDFNTRSRS